MPLDPITTLGCELRRPIPKGPQRVAWMHTDKGYREIVAALRRGGYHGNRLARAIYDLSLGEIRIPIKIEDASELTL